MKKNTLETLIRQALKEAKRPDYPDVDGDGDRKEPMAKAFKDKKLKEAENCGEQYCGRDKNGSHTYCTSHTDDCDCCRLQVVKDLIDGKSTVGGGKQVKIRTSKTKRKLKKVINKSLTEAPGCRCKYKNSTTGKTGVVNIGSSCKPCTQACCEEAGYVGIADDYEDGGKIVKGGGLKRAKKHKKQVAEAEMTAGENNTTFKIKVDVSNKQSETKLGIRIQLTPKEGMLEPDVKDKLEATVMKKLNTSLGEFDIQVSKDTDVPDPAVIGFFIPLSQIKNMIVSAVKGGATPTNNTPTPPPAKPATPPAKPTPPAPAKPTPPAPAKPAVNENTGELIKEMRVRDLKEISKVVIKEDFYAFINAGQNVLRTMEGKGLDNGKKYLEYLVKHNIM